MKCSTRRRAKRRSRRCRSWRSGSGRVVIEHARFAFRPGEYVIDGLNLVAEPNATTALVGPSGGGKTTILGLIQRFYALSHGPGDDRRAGHRRRRSAFAARQDRLRLAGCLPVSRLDPREYRGRRAPAAREAEIVAAARKAHAHDFILQFAAGYDTNVGEQGAQLSGGQRQRIAIARAILKDAPILLLDEPTAALDSESEREVQKALDDLRIGRTTLVVAHRLQTIVDSNRIWVIEGGRAVETGEHQELIARRGAYYAFFAAQFGASAALPIA